MGNPAYRFKNFNDLSKREKTWLGLKSTWIGLGGGFVAHTIIRTNEEFQLPNTRAILVGTQASGCSCSECSCPLSSVLVRFQGLRGLFPLQISYFEITMALEQK